MKLLIATFLIFSSFNCKAQEDSLQHKFDFWIGEWNLTWINADSSISKGENIIERTHNEKVIQENFKALDGPFKGYEGSSWSVYNPISKAWKQTWVDNQGGYLDFTGSFDDNKRIFQRETITAKGITKQRMVFHLHTKDRFTWDWENSSVDSESWNLQWRIEYRRK